MPTPSSSSINNPHPPISRPGTGNSVISSISSGPSSHHAPTPQQQFSLWRGRPSAENTPVSASSLPPRRPETTQNTSSSVMTANSSVTAIGSNNHEDNSQQQHFNNYSSSSARPNTTGGGGGAMQNNNNKSAQFLRSTLPGFANSTQSRRQKLGTASSTSSRVIGTNTNLDELFSAQNNNNSSNQHQMSSRPNTSSNANNNNNIASSRQHYPSSSNSSTTGGELSNFRSPAVSIQVALHEIAANVIPKGQMPDSHRARKLLELLRNTGTLCSDTVMSHVLHILSLELHRCVFGPSHLSIQKYADNLLSAAGSGAGGQPVSDPSEEDDDVPYFEQLEEVSREHRLLLAELNAVENTNRQDQMAAELEKFKQVVPFYEHEIGRLNRESTKKAEETDGLKDELGILQRIHERSITDFEVQNKLLLKDVRELQVRLFQVSKNAIETEAGEEMYQMLKTTKSEQLHGLFEQCNERATVSLFLIQIEFLLNNVISRHEGSILNSPCRRWPQLVINFRQNNTENLLEEYNHLADRREQIDVLDKVQHSENQKSTKGPASSDCTMRSPLLPSPSKSNNNNNNNNNPAAASTRKAKLLTSKEKAAKMFGERLAPPTGEDSIANKLKANLHFGPNVQAFHRNAVQPLLELTGTKRFRTSIEVHTESTTGDEALLKTVQTLNPLQTMKLPARTNLLKLKFLNPMLKNPARNFGDDDRDLLVEETIKSGANVMDWLPDNSGYDGSNEENKDESNNNNNNQNASARKSPSSSPSPTAASRRPQNLSLSFMSTTGDGGTTGSPLLFSGSPTKSFNDNADALLSTSSSSPTRNASSSSSIWDEFRSRFGSYHPAMPRKVRVDLCDLHMCRAFLILRKNIFKKFKVKVEDALKSGAETLDSAIYIALSEAFESFSPRSLQSALLESLEELYVYPELIMKVGYELLTAMETHVKKNQAPHLDIYIRALTGRVNPFCAHFIAIVNFKLGANWPQPTLREDDPAGAIPPTDVLALFSMIFPNADTELFRSDAVPPVEPFLEQYLGGVVADEKQTLAAVRRFMNQMITEQSDPWSLKINEAVTFYAEETQWSQLDGEGTYQAVKNLLVHSSTNISAKERRTGNDATGSSGGVSSKNKSSSINFGDGTDFKNQMLLHHIWTCAERGTENRLPLEDCTRLVTEMIAVATHSSAMEMPEEYDGNFL